MFAETESHISQVFVS